MKESELFHSKRKQPDLIEQEAGREGIALVIFNSIGRVLLLRERDPDGAFGRNSGDLDILSETMGPGERIREAFLRGVFEEAGIEKDSANKLFRFIWGSYCETNGQYREAMDYQYHYYCGALEYLGDPDQDPNAVFKSRDGEIEFYQWADYRELDSLQVENGAKLLIDYYHDKFFSHPGGIIYERSFKI